MPAELWRHSRFRHLRSVRGRVTLAASAIVAIVLVLVSTLLLRLQESSAIEHLDELLSDEAEAIGMAIVEGHEIPALLDDDRVLLVIGPDGGAIATEGDTSELELLDVRTPDDRGVDVTFAGERHRVVTEPFFPEPGAQAGWVVIAEPRDELDDSVTDLDQTLRWIVPLTLVLLIVIIWFVVGLTLRPVEKMRRQVASVGIRELDRRVPVPPGDDEISRLAVTMNDMLGRLETSVRRQQRFVADASHELRTPLARMRAEVEADSLDPGAADVTRTLQSQLDEIDTLRRMVDDMLVLARSDAGFGELPTDEVDLDDLVLDEVRRLRLTTPHTVDSSATSAARVHGSADDLRRVVRNLLDNAARYATDRIAVSLAEHGSFVVLHVDDDGPGIPDERRGEVFERFRRVDDSRDRASGQSGLGLAIVEELTTRHSGTVEIHDSPLGGARFTMTLPVGGS